MCSRGPHERGRGFWQEASKAKATAAADKNCRNVRLDDLVKDTTGATHALFCGVRVRDGNEAKYQREALEKIEEFQNRSSRCSSEGHEGQENTEVVLVDVTHSTRCACGITSPTLWT